MFGLLTDQERAAVNSIRYNPKATAFELAKITSKYPSRLVMCCLVIALDERKDASKLSARNKKTAILRRRAHKARA